MKIGVLCSGQLGYEVLLNITQKYQVSFVLTDKGSSVIIEFCKNHELPFYAGNPRDGRGYNFIKDKSIDVLASVNYLFLIEEDIISHPKKVALNIHGSLLPKYRGRTPHVWAIINNESETGITVHKIDNGCDTGDIIKQVVIPIRKEYTGGDILSIFQKKYPSLVIEVLENIEKNNVVFQKQNESNATFFGKRTPKDGLIDWNWTRERIYNWVRAQADPYPGAFTYYEGKKVIIDKVGFSNHLIDYQVKNGTILKSEGITLVKASDGVLELLIIRENNLEFELYKVFKNE